MEAFWEDPPQSVNSSGWSLGHKLVAHLSSLSADTLATQSTGPLGFW